MFCDVVVQGMSCDTWDEFSNTILLRYLSYLYGTLYMDPSASLSNDPGKVDSNFFCFAAMVLSPHRNVLIFTQRMHKPT